MNCSVTARDLLEGSEQRLGLVEPSAEPMGKASLGGIEVQHYNGACRLHHAQSLIMTQEDIDRLTIAPRGIRENVLQEIISHEIPLVVLARVERLPQFLDDFSQAHEIPFLCSLFDEFFLETRIMGLLREKLFHVAMKHGVLVSLEGWGTLITGESGTGKTTCACELVHMGHRWVADDVVVLEKGDNGMLYGRGHDRTQNLLEIKGRGIVRADEVFDPGTICRKTAVCTVIALDCEDSASAGIREGDYQCIMGVTLPVLHISGFPVLHNTAIHVDRAVRDLVGARLLS